MFQRFKSSVSLTSEDQNGNLLTGDYPFEYLELLSELGGTSYDNGLYSIYSFQQAVSWTTFISTHFLHYRDSVLSFARDWKGRQFCTSKDDQSIYIFDPADFQAYKLPAGIFEFHNEVLVEFKAEDLDVNGFKQLKSYLNIENLDSKYCIGLIKPLFLNGKEVEQNMKVYDLEFYWDVTIQLFRQLTNVPSGTRINKGGVNPFS